MANYRFLIDGRLVEGARLTPVVNPATEETIALCPRASEELLNLAVAAAKAAFPSWAATSIQQRREMISRIPDIIEAHLPELAHLLTSEQGKPLPDATGELYGMVAFFRHMVSLDLPVRITEDNADRRVELHRRPLGVVGAIMPWNYPLLLIALKVPAALIAGNTMVLKTAPTTPLATLRLAELIVDVLPPGVLNIITDENDLGDVMTRHSDIRKISFTGSATTGKKVMSAAAETLKRITLELGGNDAAIVLDDVEVKRVAEGVFAGAFENNGQLCLAIKRAYVHEAVYDQFCDELVKLANNVVVDDGMKQGTKLGPLQNKTQYDKVLKFLEDAKRHGKVIAGGEALDRPGYFIAPTIVRDIQEGASVVDDEQFGPILPVIKFAEPADAVQRANNTSYGLGGSVWSSNPDRAYDLAKQLDAGTVWINKHFEVLPHVPFGGAKQSGIGVELAEEGLEEFTQLQVVNR
jgi:acyl-CoA reductase-like NAD-dependent aldehyde dehydrogenase